MNRFCSCQLLLLIAFSLPLHAADIAVTEGTGFSVTLAPDHSSMAIDLQGSLWQVPAKGGSALRLTDGMADDRLPRFSPDGTTILFQSFAAGSWNIHVLSINTGLQTALTSGPQDDREPVWSPAGHQVLFASDRSGNYDIWTLDIASGLLQQLTTDPADDYAPALSPDGKTLAYISVRKGKPGLYLKSGSAPELHLTGVSGARLFTPAFSPDGTSIALVRAEDAINFPSIAANQLVIAGLNGAIRVLSAPDEDVFPFAPAWFDDNTLAYTSDGQIKVRSLLSANMTTVPFSAKFPIAERNYKRKNLAAQRAGSQAALGLISPVSAPGGLVLFSALGNLWQRAANGAMTQLTDDVWVERDLAISPDGKQLAYISDRDGSMQVWQRNLASGECRRLTSETAGVRFPTWSPDGKMLAFQKVGPIGTQDFTLHLLDLATGSTRKLKAPPLWPESMSFSGDGQYLLIAVLTATTDRFRDGVNRLLRVPVDGGEPLPMPLPPGFDPDAGVTVAPNGQQLALLNNGTLWLVAMSADGSLQGDPRLTLDELVDYPAWTANSQTILFIGPHGLAQLNLADGKHQHLTTNLNWTPQANTGRMLIHAGRVFTGMGDKYQNDMDILIDGNRITAVTPHQTHPAGLRTIDAAGQTVLPGLIDQHAHHEAHQGEWLGRAWLAYGVTTVVEPGGLPYESREQMEAWSSGVRSGPRLFFAGPQLDGARRYFPFAAHIRDAQRLQRELQRADRLGYALIKTYTRMPNDMQQIAIDGAHRLGLPVTAHALYPSLASGADRTEHLRGTSRLGWSDKQSDLLKSYGDVTAIAGAGHSAITPTIVVGGGFIQYLLEHPDINTLPQYRALYSDSYRRNLVTFSRIVGRRKALLDQGIANARAAVLGFHQAGTRIVAGTDSPIFPYGLALIIELANYQAAGLSTADTLRTATVNAAAELGASEDLGSIAPGLLADLIIVDGDPLVNINDLLNIETVIKNGSVFSLADLLQPPTE